jgi:hypothetical protein
MKTDALIKAIAEDGATRSPSVAARMALALAIAAGISGALFMLTLGARPDIDGAAHTWRFVAKVVIVLACLVAAWRATAQLARPEADRRRVLAVLLLPAALLVLAIGWELVTSPAETWAARAVGTNSMLCLVSITLLSVAPLLAVMTALRAGAPRSPTLAGALAGLLAGSLAATLYALHCFDDSPLFVALWYSLAIALVVLVGAAAGARALRW